MSGERNRGLLERAVREAPEGVVQLTWVDPGDGWAAHVRLRGASGRVAHVLTSPEVQEARFEEPSCSVCILTSTDEDEVLEALAKLARAVFEYSSGGGHVEPTQGRFVSGPVLVLHTADGEWRIGRRSGSIPY